MGIELTNEQVYCIYELENWWNKRDKQVFEISGAAGTGKALVNETTIPTTNEIKKIKDIKIGDFVFNRHGKAVKVLGVYPQGKLPTYRVRFDDGSFIDCNDEHIWTYLYSNEESNNIALINNSYQSKELKYIIEDTNKNGYTIGNSTSFIYKIPITEPVEYEEKDFSNIDIDYVDKSPYSIGKLISEHINEFNIIPEDYHYGSISQRFDLLAGICDNISNIGKDSFGSVTIKSTNMNMLLSIKYFVSSLGIKSIITKSSNLFPKYNNDDSNYLQLMPKSVEVGLNIFKKNNRNKRKLEEILSSNEYLFINHSYLGISKIEKLNEEKEMTCIMVDDDEHLYLCGPFIPTHNTTIVKYFIERLGLTTDNVLFVAYMGKAATQLIRNGLPAKTIHSAIYDYEQIVEKDEDGYTIFDSRGKPATRKEFVLKEKLSKKIKLIVLDEASMVSKDIAEDLLSFGIPVVTLGDLNQLPPVFGNPYFLVKPDFILHQVMRQAEGSPVVYLSQKVLNDEQLKFGVYGSSFVIPKSDISDFHFKKADIVLTGTNKLRYNINNYFRENLKRIKNLEYPHINEKVVCRKNNWDMSIGDGIYLTNGMTGFVDYIYRDSYNKRTMMMDFRPDFSKKTFKKVEFDYKHLYDIPGNIDNTSPNWFYDKMEFAYSISVHTSQGSQWPYVLYLFEDYMQSNDTRKKMMYTAITRASETIGIVL